MTLLDSYTADELESKTGFDRRTVAYYVQKGLIPKVGRRGPRTRYPQLVMDRLLFIRRVREAEEAGEIEAVSLAEIQQLFERVPAEVIRQMAERELPSPAIEEAIVRFGGVRRISANSFDPAIQKAVGDYRLNEDERIFASPPNFEEVDAGGKLSDDAAPIPLAEPGELGALLGELQSRLTRRKAGKLESWSRIEISDDIELSVRGAKDGDIQLLTALQMLLSSFVADGASGRKG